VALGANETLTLSNAANDTFGGVISGTGTSGLTLTTGAETLSASTPIAAQPRSATAAR